MPPEPTPSPTAAVRDLLTEAMEGTIGVRNPRPEVLDLALRAAREAAPRMRGADGTRDAAAFEELGKDLPGDLQAWLFELPSFLAKKEREEQGHELCNLYTPLFGPEYMDAERAIVFLEAGKKEDAKAFWEKCHEQHGDHPWVLLRGAALHERSGDVRAARRLHEQALESARRQDDRWQLRFAYDGLITHLQENNEQAASVELGRRMLEDLPEIRDEFKTEQIFNKSPKVGRNDPCPCGSGKKYKKCCGHA